MKKSNTKKFLGYISSRLLAVLLFLIFSTFSPIHTFGENASENKRNSDVVKDPGNQSLRRVREIGGEVIIDGTLRVFEPSYEKVVDLVEVSTTPVLPAANHIRLYAVAVGTYTILRAVFDDGTTQTIGHN